MISTFIDDEKQFIILQNTWLFYIVHMRLITSYT